MFPRGRGAPRGLAFTCSRDAGQTFAPPQLVPESSDSAGGTNGSQQGLLMRKLAVTPAGQSPSSTAASERVREAARGSYAAPRMRARTSQRKTERAPARGRRPCPVALRPRDDYGRIASRPGCALRSGRPGRPLRSRHDLDFRTFDDGFPLHLPGNTRTQHEKAQYDSQQPHETHNVPPRKSEATTGQQALCRSLVPARGFSQAIFGTLQHRRTGRPNAPRGCSRAAACASIRHPHRHRAGRTSNHPC